MTIVTMVWGSLSLDNFGFMKTSESLMNTELSKFHEKKVSWYTKEACGSTQHASG